MTGVIVFALGGALVADITLSEQLINSLNPFLNFLTIALIVYRDRHFRKDVEPKVDHVVEQVEQVVEVVERRKLNEPTEYDERRGYNE